MNAIASLNLSITVNGEKLRAMRKRMQSDAQVKGIEAQINRAEALVKELERIKETHG